MPMYEFVKSDDSSTIERHYNMSDTRPEKIEIDNLGRERHWKDNVEIRIDDGFDPSAIVSTWTRNFAAHRVNGNENMQYPYASLRLKGQISEKDAKHEDCTVRGVPHTGVPIIRSKKHEAEVARKYGLVRE